MRQRTSALLIAVLITGSLAASPLDEGRETPIQRIVHHLKHLVVTTFEDLLTIPKP